jgi:hypothetical protein
MAVKDLLKQTLGGSSSGGSSGNILSNVVKPDMVANLTSKLPLGEKIADTANKTLSGISNQDLVSGAQKSLDFVQNLDMPKIDVSSGMPVKLPSIGGDVAIFDPLARGIQSAYGGIKDFFSGDKKDDIRNAQAEYEAMQRGEQPLSVQDKLIRETKRIGGQIGGGLDALKQAAVDNKALLNMGIQGSAAYAGYQAGKGAREQVGGLLGQQLQEMQGVGSKFQGVDYDPQRYAEQQQFLRDRITGGGYTAEEKQMQQQGDIRGAKASAAARLAGIEQMARLSGATGSGAALASALTGGQAMGNIQAETEAGRQASAQQKMESAIQQQTQLSRQKTAEEADLAKQQADLALQRQQQVGATREKMGSNILDTATQEAGFYGKLADLGTNILLESETEKAARLQREALQKQKDDAEIARINAETAYLTSAQRGKATQAQKDALDKATQASSIIQKNTQTITQSPDDGTKTPNLVMQQPTTTQPNMSVVPKQIQNPLDQLQKNVSQGLNMSQQNMSVGTPDKAIDGFNKQNIPIQKPAVKPAPTPTAVQKPAVSPKPMMQPNPTATPAPKPVPTANNQTKKPLGR